MSARQSRLCNLHGVYVAQPCRVQRIRLTKEAWRKVTTAVQRRMEQTQRYRAFDAVPGVLLRHNGGGRL